MLIARPHRRTPASVADSWRRIEAWFATHQPEVLPTLSVGTTMDRLSNFEHSTGLTLPEDVKESYLIHDGQNDRYGPGLFLGALLSPLDGVREAWKLLTRVEAWEDQHLGEEDPGFHSSFPRDAIRNLGTSSRWVGLVDWDGDYLGIDLDPGPRGVCGQVINFTRSAAVKYVWALSWAHFLEDMADEMKAGELVVVADEFSEHVMRNNRRVARASDRDAQLFGCGEEWAKAKLPTDFQKPVDVA